MSLNYFFGKVIKNFCLACAAKEIQVARIRRQLSSFKHVRLNISLVEFIFNAARNGNFFCADLF